MEEVLNEIKERSNRKLTVDINRHTRQVLLKEASVFI